jgi:hypothetical protein
MPQQSLFWRVNGSFIKPTCKYMEANLLPIFQDKVVKLLFSELQEADVAYTGASALVDFRFRKIL